MLENVDLEGDFFLQKSLVTLIPCLNPVKSFSPLFIAT